MNKLVLIVLAPVALALSSCATLGSVLTRGTVNKVCVEAVKGAHTAQDIAVILERHGVKHDDAQKLAEKAARGEILITQLCVIADVLLASKQ